jgi:xanthine dehydrogenase YagR molybdenum-binding subunit
VGGAPAGSKSRGDAAHALANAAARIDAEYRIPVEHHNPMELFGTTVVREADGKLTVYDKTQGMLNVQGYLSSEFSYSENNIRVLSPFVGGAFGLGLRPQYQVFLAVLAAHVLKRSVRVSLTRQQMFGLGYRPDTWQRVALGAAPDGRLQGLIHEAVQNTSRFEDYTEKTLLMSARLYGCANAAFDYKAVQLDLQTPIDMRAPGAATGLYALECAMDELAVTLRIDPLELRLRNYAETDQDAGLPFSSKALRECYRQGAKRFGWARRKPDHTLAEYHVPVNADIHDIDVIFVHEDDDVVNPLGAKGLGEIGVVGVAAAIANAVFHATGRRIRTLPITLDKVM